MIKHIELGNRSKELVNLKQSVDDIQDEIDEVLENIEEQIHPSVFEMNFMHVKIKQISCLNVRYQYATLIDM